jgi:hypothetical protein
MGLFEVLGWPLEQAKKATPGEDWFDRPEWMPHEAWAASQVAGDLFLDPLNLLPVGLLAKGAKAGKQAFTKGAGKGQAISASPNYIKNFYGLTDGSVERLNPAEKATSDLIQKATGRPFNESLGMVRKATGMADWATQSARGAAEGLMSPTGRALYKEQGVNPATQRLVKGYMDEGSRKATEKATANVNYLQHIQQQAGRQGPVHPAMAEIANRSNLETYTPNEPGVISDWMKTNAGTEAGGEAVELSDNVANYIENHVKNAWGNADTLVMKRARSGTGGNHFNDMYRGKLAPVGPLREAFLKEDSIEGIYRHLKKNENKGANFWKVKTKSADDLAENGLWLTGSGPGSAITEGGVNWVMKVDPDGTLMSVISDKHDFLEKIPGVGKVAEEMLPNELVAVTPPMFANIKNIRKSQFEKAGHAAPTRAVSGVQRAKQPKEATTLTLLEEFVSATPSQQAVKAEQLKQAGMLSAVPALAGGESD